METLNFLAGFWGISMVIISLSLLVRPKHIQNLLALAEDEKNLTVFGLVNVMVGATFLMAYNTLDFSWGAIVTILACLVLFRGICVLFFTDAIRHIAQMLKGNTDILMPFFLFFVLLGCFLTYASFLF